MRPEGITEEMVQESVERAMGKIDTKGIRRQLNSVENILEMDVAPATQRSMLRGVAEVVSTMISPHVSCGAGCDHCCHMACTISIHEAKIIGARIGVDPKPVKIELTAHTRSDMVDKYTGVPCPFLKEKKCSIYDIRPLSCRTYFNLSAYPEICDVVKHPGNEVPALDLSPIWMADVLINATPSAPFVYGDIREYFPD